MARWLSAARRRRSTIPTPSRWSRLWTDERSTFRGRRYPSTATLADGRDPVHNGSSFRGYRKHLGIYAYRKAALERFAALLPSPLELTERLEQLRLLENGIALYVAEAPADTIGVDTEADLLRAEAVLKQRLGI